MSIRCGVSFVFFNSASDLLRAPGRRLVGTNRHANFGHLPLSAPAAVIVVPVAASSGRLPGRVRRWQRNGRYPGNDLRG